MKQLEQSFVKFAKFVKFVKSKIIKKTLSMGSVQMSWLIGGNLINSRAKTLLGKGGLVRSILHVSSPTLVQSTIYTVRYMYVLYIVCMSHNTGLTVLYMLRTVGLRNAVKLNTSSPGLTDK